MPLQGKKIIIGICGSIAAYKIALLSRLLVKQNAEVQIIMTPEAKEFITPLTLATLSKKPVLSDYYDPLNGKWHNHVELGLNADLLVIAPASANTLSKMAQGACDNLLLATYLSARCPVVFAPAMDLDMWKHPATQSNISKLISYGNQIITPGTGELASGLIGEGRLAEPEDILNYIINFFSHDLPLKGKKALITAGPTYEAIDPVRFIGNHSSGKMGYAIAEQLKRLGANVTLISGPTSLSKPAGITTIYVESAQQMFDNCKQHFSDTDIMVMSAAVADYTPVEVATQKIKKSTEDFTIQLKKTSDILAFLGTQKQKKQTLVGFALETNNELENAKNKLIRKNLDYIVLNSMQDKGAGFGTDTNKITIISKSNQESKYQLKSKDEVAKDICRHIIEHQNLINS